MLTRVVGAPCGEHRLHSAKCLNWLNQTTSRLRLHAAVAACALAAVLLAHGVLELASRRAEAHGAYLWFRHEYLQAFSPASHAPRGGARRMLLCGPSEAREALRYGVFDAELPGIRARQSAQSWGTVADCTLLLEYIDASYGPDAMPEYLVLGTTVRWLSNEGLEMSPLVRAVDDFSPDFRVASPLDAPRLVPKGVLDGLASRVRFRLQQERRYKGALLALACDVWPPLEESGYVAERLEPYRFATKRPIPEARLTRFRGDTTGLWERVRQWDAREDAARVRRDLGRILDLCARRGVRVVVVNLPVRSLVRDFYDDGRYAAYLDVLRAAIGETPFLDLGDFLGDDEFFDSVHPTLAGGRRTSRAVARFVAETSLDPRSAG
jgi:hypothetical protein